MPIEIKELHIRVAIDASAPGQMSQAQGAPPSAVGAGTGDKDAIIAECVDQIMHILQTKSER